MPTADKYWKNPELHRKLSAGYKERNKEKAKKWERERTQRNRATLRLIKETTPCLKCGHYFPHYVMQFHHVRGKKLCNVTAMTSMATGKMLAEVAKCEIVCANCHCIETHKELAVRKALSKSPAV